MISLTKRPEHLLCVNNLQSSNLIKISRSANTKLHYAKIITIT